jgi:photosystem II stability/assembly factor-like uncharacterized protein
LSFGHLQSRALIHRDEWQSSHHTHVLTTEHQRNMLTMFTKGSCLVLHLFLSFAAWTVLAQQPTPAGSAGWIVGCHGTIMHTMDGGNTWWPQNSGTQLNLYGVAFVTPQSGWAVGDHGIILHTENGGASWRPQSSGTLQPLDSVAFVTPQSGWVTGEHGTILHTADRGKSWSVQSSSLTGSSQELYSVGFETPQLGWVVGQDESILRTEDARNSWKNAGTGTFVTLF